MKQQNRNIAILIVLICVSLTLSLFTGGSKSSNIDRVLFQVKDTTLVKNIIIDGPKGRIEVKRSQGNWVLNDTLQVDPSLIRIFNALMSQVQVSRLVSTVSRDEIAKDLLESGQKVEIELDNEQLSFYTGGNAAKTQTYFATADFEKIYLVEIPGYRQYLAGIYELSANQWRDRVLFNSNWRTLQKLTITYANKSKTPLDVYFEDRSLLVRGVQALDTASLVGYVDQLENFQLNDYLEPGQYPRYDSLLNTTAIATVVVKDINGAKNRMLDIYGLIPGQRFYLLSDQSKQMIVVDVERMNGLLLEPKDFQSN